MPCVRTGHPCRDLGPWVTYGMHLASPGFTSFDRVLKSILSGVSEGYVCELACHVAMGELDLSRV